MVLASNSTVRLSGAAELSIFIEILFLFRTLFYTNFETRSCSTKTTGCRDSMPNFRPYQTVRLSHRLNSRAFTSYLTLYTLKPSFRPNPTVQLSYKLNPRACTSYPTLYTLKPSFMLNPTVRLKSWVWPETPFILGCRI